MGILSKNALKEALTMRTSSASATMLRAMGLMSFFSAFAICQPQTTPILALRFNPTGAFTTAPVYPQSGSPVIVSTPAK